jgi:hypothetical protein
VRVQGTIFALVNGRLSRVFFAKATKSTYSYWYWYRYGFVSSASLQKAKHTSVRAALNIISTRSGDGIARWIGILPAACTIIPSAAENATSEQIKREINTTATVIGWRKKTRIANIFF